MPATHRSRTETILDYNLVLAFRDRVCNIRSSEGTASEVLCGAATRLPLMFPGFAQANVAGFQVLCGHRCHGEGHCEPPFQVGLGDPAAKSQAIRIGL